MEREVERPEREEYDIPRDLPEVEGKKQEPRVSLGTQRCPFCRSDVNVEATDWVACKACLARHHRSCWGESKKCAACGREDVLVPRRRRPLGKTLAKSLVLSGLLAAVWGPLIMLTRAGSPASVTERAPAPATAPAVAGSAVWRSWSVTGPGWQAPVRHERLLTHTEYADAILKELRAKNTLVDPPAKELRSVLMTEAEDAKARGDNTTFKDMGEALDALNAQVAERAKHTLEERTIHLPVMLETKSGEHLMADYAANKVTDEDYALGILRSLEADAKPWLGSERQIRPLFDRLIEAYEESGRKADAERFRKALEKVPK